MISEVVDICVLGGYGRGKEEGVRTGGVVGLRGVWDNK